MNNDLPPSWKFEEVVTINCEFHLFGLTFAWCEQAEPPSIPFGRIFTVFQGLIRVYGITIHFTGFPASFSGSLWLVFFTIPMEKQAINFPENVHNAQSNSELSHGYFKFSWNDSTKYGK